MQLSPGTVHFVVTLDVVRANHFGVAITNSSAHAAMDGKHGRLLSNMVLLVLLRRMGCHA
jgi:hypothetical protein